MSAIARLDRSLYRLYRRALLRRQTPPRPGDRAFESLVRMASLGLQAASGVRFPPQTRTQGGWYWTWRWRFEFLMGWLDMESVAAVRKAVSPGSAALDIGAHAGYYSLLLSRLVGPQGAVVAFEPDTVNHKVLQSNLGARGAWNVLPVRAAVSNHTGQVTLNRSAGSGNHSLFEYTQPVDRVTVNSTTVDDFVESRGIGPVSFVKMDVEGAEPLVLEGMARMLRRSPSLSMLVEYNPRALRAGGFEPRDLLERLRHAGFDLWRLPADAKPAPLASFDELDDSSPSAANLLCTRV